MIESNMHQLDYTLLKINYKVSALLVAGGCILSALHSGVGVLLGLGVGPIYIYIYIYIYTTLTP